MLVNVYTPVIVGKPTSHTQSWEKKKPFLAIHVTYCYNTKLGQHQAQSQKFWKICFHKFQQRKDDENPVLVQSLLLMMVHQRPSGPQSYYRLNKEEFTPVTHVITMTILFSIVTYGISHSKGISLICPTPSNITVSSRRLTTAWLSEAIWQCCPKTVAQLPNATNKHYGDP